MSEEKVVVRIFHKKDPTVPKWTKPYPIVGLNITYGLLSESAFRDFLMLYREMEN